MITAIVLYDLPPSIGLEECRKHFAEIAPGFLKIPGFVRKQFICSADGKVAGGAYMWKTREAAERFYNGVWLEGIRERYGNDPKISYFETVALADVAAGKAGAIKRPAAHKKAAPTSRRKAAAPRQAAASTRASSHARKTAV
jgi:Putative mono-oxygenase ydhR